MVLDLIATTLLSYNLEQLSEGVVNEVVGKWEQFETKYNKNFKEYFHRCEKKYSIVRTILNDKEQNLLNTFQPTSLFQKEKEILPENLLQLINKKKYIWITGYGGQGKSTLLRYLMLQILSNDKNGKQKIPVYIELRKFNSEKYERRNLSKFIYSEMNTLGFELDYESFEFMLKKGRFLFLLDAYDEIISDKNQLFMLEFDDFITKYGDNNFLITSRKMPKGNLENIVLLSHLELKGFSKNDAINFIKKIEYISEIKNEFLTQLDEKLYEKYNSIASNPLLLILMLKVFKQNPNFPKDISKFLIDAFKVLYEQHDVSKLGYEREFRSKFNEEQMIQFFSAFCFITYFHSNAQSKEFTKETISNYIKSIIKNYSWINKNTSLSEKDIIFDFKVCLCLLYEEGQPYYFVHNIFQEFFAAYYIYQLSEKGRKSFVSKYILSNSNNSFSNNRLFLTTFDYIYELDSFKNTRILDFGILLPLLEFIEKSENFVDFHHYFIYNFRIKRKGLDHFELFWGPGQSNDRLRLIIANLKYKQKHGNRSSGYGVVPKPLITLNKKEMITLAELSLAAKNNLPECLHLISSNINENFKLSFDLYAIEQNEKFFSVVKNSQRYKTIAEFQQLKEELSKKQENFEKEELNLFEFENL
ncbi:hypothetical protein BH747_04000 [Enterococcus villorum]|uniref:NACHT domain-containing protein n=1 Tax=Enterococcus villorum TaxID=112904 RepID=A0A1V8YEY3_9ENTE|nr:NACHT domain-containing protein [Enterococcus villorum]OQO71163.1 hypothetical protein BH747_04000 [Enterococcus villorum]